MNIIVLPGTILDGEKLLQSGLLGYFWFCNALRLSYV